MPNTAIYCPGVDKEMQESLDSLVAYKWADAGQVYKGGDGGLDKLDPAWKLYVLCHGHAKLPAFSTKAGLWTAKELAEQMIKDGLREKHRLIELLVCHSGESITTKEAAAERTAVYMKFRAAKAEGDQVKQDKLQKKFAKVAAKGAEPSLFTSEDQVIPMCAQFVQELKNRGFEYIRVVGYAAPVCQYYADGPGKVRLDTTSKGGGWGQNDELTMKQYTVTWL